MLSSCETGLGEVLSEVYVFGLRRTFGLAGAQTFVMSLWKVLDEQTKEEVVNFYERLLDGKPRFGALIEDRLAIRKMR